MAKYMLALVLLLAVAPVNAQENGKWWWAWHEDGGEVVAFDADGDSVVIASGVTVHRLNRVTDELALVVLATQDDHALYKLTSDAATQLGERYAGPYIADDGGLRLAASHWPYAIVTGADRTEFWIISLLTNDLQTVNRSLTCNEYVADTISFHDCLRFSQDGQYLRYKSSDGVADFTLWERHLESGNEQAFFRSIRSREFTTYDTCRPRGYGEEWICVQVRDHGESVSLAYATVQRDGSTRTLLKDSFDSPHRWYFSVSGDATWAIDFSSRALWPFNISDNSLILMDLECRQNCHIDVENVVSHRFDLPADGPQPADINHIIAVNSGTLLLYTNLGTDYLLSSGRLEPIGAYDCDNCLRRVSPDYRWTLSLTEDGNTVWDMRNREPAFHLPKRYVAYPFYTAYGVILHSPLIDEATAFVGYTAFVGFNDDDGQMLELDERDGRFVDMLPGHALLYVQSETSDTLEKGVYRYDADLETYTLLVPDAVFAFDD